VSQAVQVMGRRTETQSSTGYAGATGQEEVTGIFIDIGGVVFSMSIDISTLRPQHLDRILLWLMTAMTEVPTATASDTPEMIVLVSIIYNKLSYLL